MRRSHDHEKGKKALHMVSAWAVENRLVLAQVTSRARSQTRITAIPVLLRQLALAGCVVTIDAMGTQTKIAAQIVEQEGDYALALKDNQGNLYDEVKATFALAEQDDGASGQSAFTRTIEKGHGRLEIREYWTISQLEILVYLDPDQRWKGFAEIGMVRAERRIKDAREQGNSLFPAQFLFRHHVCYRRPKPLGD